MSDGLIPQRYAMALFKYAEDKNITKQVYDEMKTVVASFETNPDLNKVLANPFVSRDDKRKLLLAAAVKPDEAYSAFVDLILKHNREMFMWQMALAYRGIFRKVNRISSVVITSAVPMDEQESKRIDDMVSKAYPDRSLEFVHEVEPDIIGGFVIDVDNNRMDASISNELEQLRQNLITSN